MPGVHTEHAFEDAIESHLLTTGWVAGAPSNYRRDLGLDTAVLFEFIGATQPAKWAQLIKLHGGANEAQAKFSRRLAAEIDSRGTMEVLRHGLEDLGVKIRLAFFKPAHSLTPALVGLYDANRLVITRQVHHSEINPHDSLEVTPGGRTPPNLAAAEEEDARWGVEASTPRSSGATPRSSHSMVAARSER